MAVKKPPVKKPTAKKPAAKKETPVLVFDEGYWFIVSGTKRLNVGRSKRYAEQYLADMG